MRRIGSQPLLLPLLLGGIAVASPARAAPSPHVAAAFAQALNRLNRQFATLTTRTRRRAALLARLDRYRRAIAATRKRPAGPARDFKLRGLLAEARALAGRISRLDQQIHRLSLSVDRARAALARRFDALNAAQRARARAALSRTRRGRRAVRVLRVAHPKIRPLDGPGDIEEKADLLRDSAEKVRLRLAEIERVIARLEKRQRLRRISRRVDRYTGLFAEDTSQRRVTRIRPNRTTAGDQDPSPAASPEGRRDGAQGGSYHDGLAGAGLDAQNETTPATSPGTYAVVLREVLTAATVQALKRADLQRDPAARLRALKRARRELARTARELQERARAYRHRAVRLRRREGKRRRQGEPPRR